MHCTCGRCPLYFSYLMEADKRFEDLGIEDPGIESEADPIEPGTILIAKFSLFGEPDHDHGRYTILKSAHTKGKIGMHPKPPGGVVALAEIGETSDAKRREISYRDFRFLFFYYNDYGAVDLSAARLGSNHRIYYNDNGQGVTWRDMLFWFQKLVEAKDLSRQFGGGDYFRMSLY